MLKIKTLRGAGAASHYYRGERARGRRPDEYYSGDGTEAPATWWTPGDSLGVQSGAQVKPEELREAMAGRDPTGSGKALVRMQRQPGKTERRGGFDLHLAPPKSVSVMFAAADPATRRGMLEDLRAAAQEVMAEFHSRGAFVTRQGAGGKVRGSARDVLVAMVPHRTSRSGDPQLHVHCVLVNLARRPDGKTGGLEIGPAFDAKAEAGALFRASVAAAMERRGAAVERVPGQDGQRATSFRVAGVDPALERAFSSRKATMERAAEKAGGLAQDGAKRREQTDLLARRTRGAKAQVPRGEDLERRWQAAMERQGVTPAQVWERAREAARTVERPALSSAEAVALQVQKAGGQGAEDGTLRRRVAEEEQFRGGGAAGALREAHRLVREGWHRIAAEVGRRFQQVKERLGFHVPARERQQPGRDPGHTRER